MNKLCRKAFLRTAAACALLPLAALPVLAQVAAGSGNNLAAAGNAAPQGEATGQMASLKEIVVTAERRAEPIQNVPITISYLSADQLEKADVRSLGDIASITPGLRFDYSGNFAYPTIRGVGTTLADAGSGTNVGIYVDGFYSPNPTVSNFQLLNVQSIQVLKGPQGTLFGSNTSGGAILLTTTPPSSQTNAMASATYSSFNTQRYQTYFTTAVTHDLAFDIAGMFTQSDGWIHDIAEDDRDVGAYQDYSLRTGLLFTPADNLSFLLRYEHAGTNDPVNMTDNAWEGDTGVPQVFGRFIPGTIITTDPNQVSYTEPVATKLHNNAFQLTSKYDFGAGTLTSYTQYRKDDDEQFLDEDFDSARLEYLDITNHEHTFTQEFLMNSHPGGPLQWTGGVWIMNERDMWPTLGSIADAPTTFLAGSAVTVRSFAGYFNLTYQLTQNLFLTGGFRYTHDEQSEGYYRAGPGPELLFPTLSANRGTPRAVIRYVLNQYSNVYASFSTGFKATIYNVGGGQLTPVLPESLKAYEIGYKFAAPTVSADLSSYFYNYKDLQVESYAVINDIPVSIVNNAAVARIWGFDGDLKFRITQAWQATLGADYTHAIYTSYPDDPTYTECLSLAACGAAYGLYLDTVTNGSGDEMSRAPKFTGDAGLTYTTLVPGGGDLALSATYYYTAAIYFGTAADFKQAAYSTLGARAQWTSPSGHWSAALFGDNITDTRYLTQVLPGTFGIGATWAPPTSVGVNVSYRFH
jgi:iron complex outermembrane recepter protein